MPIKCDNCGNKPATVHLTEIKGGKKLEKHLCEQCAAEEGVTIKAQIPLGEILKTLVAQSSQEKELSGLLCPVCGLTFQDFRQQHVLGCPNDYQVFETFLAGLLERAHEGASVHVGKVPAHAGANERRQAELLRLRGQLKDAVTREDYEAAAALRDRIKEMELS